MNCSMTRSNRLRPASLAGELDKIFRIAEPSFVFGPRRSARPGAVPPINVWEDEQNVYVESEVPGFAMENLDISITASELSIRGRRESHGETEQKPQGDNVVYHRRERVGERGEFQRTLRIGVPVDHDKVGAVLKHGVLLVTLPKSEAAKPRKIEVNVK